MTAVQSAYSLWKRNIELNGVLETREVLGVGFVPWSPVGAGSLTGKYNTTTKCDEKTDFRAGFPRFYAEFMPLNMPIMEWLENYLTAKGTTPSQISLAWLLAKSPNIVPIPGTRNETHLLKNLETFLSKFPVYGDRMGQAHMSSIDYTT